MRHRHVFPADLILSKADQIDLRLYRRNGRTVGITYEVSGTLLDPFADDEEGDLVAPDAAEARAILRALLAEGGAE